MKTLSRFLSKIATCLLIAVLTLGMFACQEVPNGGNQGSSDPGSSGSQPGQDFKGVEISITSDVDQIKYGESAHLTVVLKNSKLGYDVSVQSSLSDLVSISDDDVVTMTRNIVSNRTAMITAVSREDNNVKASVTISLLPAPVEGTTANLTSDMIAEIGNSSITATATVTDYVESFLDSSYNSADSYKSVVKMQENLWYGAWTSVKPEGSSEEDIWNTSIYGKGDQLVETYDFELGQLTTGYPLETYYINKNNEVSKKVVTDSDSYPVLWNSQHNWNHLGELVVTNFTLVENGGEVYYSYKIDPTEMNPDEVDSLWLPTYLVYSLTAMVSDTFHSLAIYVQDDHITKIKGTTEFVYTLANGEYTDASNAEYLTYSEIEIDLSDIGSTVVPMPEAYEADVNDIGSDKILKDALVNMQNAENYTMQIVDNSTQAPSYNGDDYTVMSATPAGSAKMAKAGSNSPFKPNSSTGTVGKYVQVTPDAIFVEETGKYSYGMDDKLYFFEYYGYKQVSEDMYDYFELDRDLGVLKGDAKLAGNISDILPTFDFASALFSFRGQAFDNQGNMVGYRYVLKDNSITGAIGSELLFEDGRNAATSTRSVLSIVVGKDGYISSVSVPYNISDIYLGSYEVRFSNFNNTVISDKVFEGYQERVIPSSWSQCNVMYYKANPLEGGAWEDMDAESVIKNIWNADSSAALGIPSAGEFISIFGDEMNGPFFDYSIDTDEDGNKYVSSREISFSFNLPYSTLDENLNLMNDQFNVYFDQINELLISKGFSCSEKNIAGGDTGRKDRKAVYAKDNVKIVISNNFTRFIDVNLYKI